MLLSCFITTAYADNWVCGYTIMIASEYWSNTSDNSLEDKNFSGYRKANGFVSFVNDNIKFFTYFTENGKPFSVWPDMNKVYCSEGLTNTYIANCNGAANIPPSYWNDCPNYSNSTHGFVCEKCPSLDDVAGTNGENMPTRPAYLNGGIGCLNYDNPDIKKLVDGTVSELHSNMCGSIAGQNVGYVFWDRTNQKLDVGYDYQNGCSYNSITITKGMANKFNTIDECYIPKDNEIHDVSGTYVFTENCHWKR